MAFSKAKMKGMAINHILFFNQFLMENKSDKYLPTLTLLQVSFRQFYQPYKFQEETKLNENVTQDLPPN